jgi:hypothetical protein
VRPLHAAGPALIRRFGCQIGCQLKRRSPFDLDPVALAARRTAEKRVPEGRPLEVGRARMQTGPIRPAKGPGRGPYAWVSS